MSELEPIDFAVYPGLEAWLEGADAASEELRRRAEGLPPPPPGVPRIGSYAEDFPEIMAYPMRDPTEETWWGRES